MAIKFLKETVEWANQTIQENEVVNKDSEFINSTLGEEPSKEFSLAIARLVIQEQEKQK